MSPTTIRLLLELLDQVTIPGSHPRLEETASAIANARRELLAARTEDLEAATESSA